ncbi:MAG: hypothetical protein V3T17_14210 [Pseudomonadales bacterium]
MARRLNAGNCQYFKFKLSSSNCQVQTVKFKQCSHGQKGGVTCMDALMPQAHGCAGAAYNT